MRVQVFTCGNSREGKLGQGEEKPEASVHYPRRVVGLEDVTPVRVVAGAFHTLVLTSTGTVRAPLHDSSALVASWPMLTDTFQLYAFGYRRNGRLGLGDDTNRSVATLITGLCGSLPAAFFLSFLCIIAHARPHTTNGTLQGRKWCK